MNEEMERRERAMREEFKEELERSLRANREETRRMLLEFQTAQRPAVVGEQAETAAKSQAAVSGYNLVLRPVWPAPYRMSDRMREAIAQLREIAQVHVQL